MKLPDKAIDIIDEARASIKINEKEKKKMLAPRTFNIQFLRLQIFQKALLTQMKN